MRPVLLIIFLTLYVSVCRGQIDTTRARREPSPSAQVPIPGIDTPLSGPGTLLQSSPQPNAVVTPQNSRKKRKLKTMPPSDPRAFGVAIPIESTKKDTIR
ncbi:hypothetical protein WBJ53_03630 [Spirosoma sp. SC4-14]|uniref:hypothetical protein n=1 Tax=Spirosoma sp. SC4-14 TaxID=3128900 RepID=UPI0030CF4252